ncbi:MATE family efflux transporter [Ancylomarina salipaludis]|uniref:Multidrug-efflux transporter n=1 Tax=Ancylomarina salipaludis TaxID=2501299 RepID=A0A4Q1JK43_9BACT|nr:MATE family efflux transporter [Ancylomarina salipaludis]RXQ91555.1 MATE family efflux transporter [Ancylomarina salipaludis]
MTSQTIRSYFQSYQSHYKGLIKLGVPVILAQLGQVTVGVIDNMMIGHVGTLELAAASFANTIFWLVIVLGTGFSYAITPLVGKARGNYEMNQVGAWFKSSMWAVLSMGIFLSLVIYIISLFMDQMGQAANVILPARTYLWIISFSIIPMMVFMGYKQFCEGLANTRVAMNIVLIANLVNIIFNYILINGKLGLPAMGLNGAGYGTLISRIFMAVSFFFVFKKGKSFKAYGEIIAKAEFAIQDFFKIWKMGVPIGAQLVMEASAFMLSTIMMGWISVAGLAAHQVVLSISTISFMVYLGIASSTTIRISSLLGENKIEEMRQAGWAAIHLVILMVIFIGLGFLLLRNQLPTLFSDDPLVIALAAQFIVVMLIYQLFDGLQIVFGSILRGMSDVNMPTLYTFIAYFIVSLPTGYLCAFTFGLKEVGIWWGLPVGLGTASILFMFRFMKLSKQKLAEQVF